MSTLLEGPYDQVSTTDKRRLQCMIPNDVYDRWFGPQGSFPLRGAQDKILARFFHLLDAYMMAENICQFDDLDNEDQLNKVMCNIEIHPLSNDH
jgi:hypothetical protein